MYTFLTDRLKNQHEAIRFIIQTPAPSRLTQILIPGKWTVKDHIAHLARYQPVFAERIGLVLAGNNPVFERYKAEDDPEFETWRQYELSTLLRKMDEDRKNLYHTISNLAAAEWSKTGIHKKYGALTVTQWTEFFILHEAHHIFTIFQLMHDTELKPAE